MTADEVPQRQLFFSRITQGTQEIADLIISLWEAIATELIPIIGSNGFDMLFARSVHLTQVIYPWLAPEKTALTASAQFTALKNNLAGHTVADAGAACQALFMSFNDLLVSLIGESLTTGILCAAFSSAATDGCDKARSIERE
ncbi:MAG TPA: hypothetical protein VLC91_07775 [Spongiibacteraceae bacterium]|nr:hypothetical protein [Spongiibacteraceae bacterium]